MTTGADHYRQAEQLLDGAAEQTNPQAARLLYAVALVHATLAQAAAVALRTTSAFLGDSPEVTDWAKAIQPSATHKSWPPQPGDIWADTSGRRWACQHPAAFGPWHGTTKPYLVCLDEPGDDNADEINRCHGPLALVYRPEPREEMPF